MVSAKSVAISATEWLPGIELRKTVSELVSFMGRVSNVALAGAAYKTEVAEQIPVKEKNAY